MNDKNQDLRATLLAFGGTLLGLGLGAIGFQYLILADFIAELSPAPAGLPARALWATLAGLALVIAGVALVVRARLRTAALMLAVLLFLILVALHVPNVIAKPTTGGAWTPAMELLALGGAALMLMGMTGGDSRLVLIGRRCFGVTLPVFGLLHFVYHDYVASVIPSWIPAPQFWAYFTGVAHVAAGLAIVTGVRARLASVLLGLMFGSWVLILHLPRVAAALNSRPEWTSLFVATAMCGSAWLVVASLTRERERLPEYHS